MSDDEYYYEGDEDFYDILYDADPAPDLADDLAEHSAHSPIYHDNPVGELGDTFSDWDYYSDDYYDDDPVLIEANVRENQDRVPKPLSAKRGRKRKLSEARDSPSKAAKAEASALLRSLRGTVWKEPTPEPAPAFKMGQDQPVALHLSTEIMQAAYNKKQGFGKGRLRRDESWANDLSLADMGLKTERSLSLHEQAAMEEHDVEDEDGIDEEAIDDTAMVDEEADELQAMVMEPYRVELQAEPDPMRTAHIQEEVDGHGPRKRRRTSTSKNKDKTIPLTPSTSIESMKRTVNDVNKDEVTEEVVSRRGNRRPAIKGAESVAINGTDTTTQLMKPFSRKRKLSASEPSATGSTAGSRVKKANTTREEVPKTAAASRPARSKKK